MPLSRVTCLAQPVSTSVAPGHTIDLQGGYTRQDGLFAGEIYNYCGRGCRAYFPPTLLFPNGSTWNRLERTTASVTHRGDWEFGKSRITAAFEGTNNQRREETLFAGEGTLASLAWQRPSQLRNYLLDGEMLTPFQTGPLSHMVTLGFDLRRETLFDQSSTSLALPDNRPKDPFMSANYAGLFVKDDIRFGNWVLSPGVRVDDTTYGSHVGPSMYLAWNATDWLTFKGGVADAFKAPNVYLGLLVASLARQIVPSARHVHLLPAAAALAVVGLVGGQMALERVFGFATALSIIVEFVGGIVFIVLVLKGAAR